MRTLSIGACIPAADDHADSESRCSLFRRCVRGRLHAWGHSDAVRCPACWRENGRTVGSSNHARSHHRRSAVDSSPSRDTKSVVRTTRDGLRRAGPSADSGMRSCAPASKHFDTRVSRHARPCFGNGFLHLACHICPDAPSRGFKMKHGHGMETHELSTNKPAGKQACRMLQRL